MYGTVPITAPGVVLGSRSDADRRDAGHRPRGRASNFARPKSSSFTCGAPAAPRRSSSASRCRASGRGGRSPRCAAASASAICTPMVRASRAAAWRGVARPARRGGAASPASRPRGLHHEVVDGASRPVSCSAQMCGWSSAAIASASRVNRSRRRGRARSRPTDLEATALQPRVAGPVDRAHAARAQRAEHFVRAEPMARLERAAAPRAACRAGCAGGGGLGDHVSTRGAAPVAPHAASR